MFPKAKFSVAEGLFLYRGVVLVALYEPRPELADGEEILATHFARTFGITASSYADAMQILERAGGRGPGEMHLPLDGYLDEVELGMMDPAEVAEELGDDVSFFEAGVHFCSERLFFAENDIDDDSEEDDD